MSKALNARVALKQDTLANWLTAKNWIPMLGEPLYVTDKNLLFIGDGVTTAAALVTKTDRAFYPGKAETSGSIDTTMPIIDLNALGMPDLPMPTADSPDESDFIEVDTTEILTLLGKGPVAFKATVAGVPMVTMPTSTNVGTGYLCTAIIPMNGSTFVILLSMTSTLIELGVVLLNAPQALHFDTTDPDSDIYWCPMAEWQKDNLINSIRLGQPIKAVLSSEELIFSSFYSLMPDGWFSNYIDWGLDNFIGMKYQLYIPNTSADDGTYYIKLTKVYNELNLNINENCNLPQLTSTVHKVSVIDETAMNKWIPALYNADDSRIIFTYNEELIAARILSTDKQMLDNTYELSTIISIDGVNKLVVLTAATPTNEITLTLTDLTPQTGKEILFPTQLITGFQENLDIPGTTFRTLQASFPLAAGQTYYVEWDGVTYECLAHAAAPAGFGLTYVYLGNGSALGFPGNNEPFAIVYVNEYGVTQALSTDFNEQHYVGVYQDTAKKQLHQLEDEVSHLSSRIKIAEEEIEIIKEQISCFRGGTQILMADGTTKDIKDVKYGDMIKSYDMANRCLIDVKSYGAYCTGYEQFWNVAGFTNGSTLYIGTNGHLIFQPDAETLAMSYNYPIGGQVQAPDGTTPLLVGCGTYDAIATEKRYELLSENGLYFANDILVGHKVTTTYHHYKRGLVPLTDDEVAEIIDDMKLYQDYRLDGLTNAEFLKDAGQLYAKVNTKQERIKKNKQRLADLDYKQVKRNQGKLSDEEYEIYLRDCDRYRQAINDDEDAIAADSIILNAFKEKHGVHSPSFKKSFREIYSKQMHRIHNRK